MRSCLKRLHFSFLVVSRARFHQIKTYWRFLKSKPKELLGVLEAEKLQKWKQNCGTPCIYIKRKDVPFRSRKRLPRNSLVSIYFTNFKSHNHTQSWQIFIACIFNILKILPIWGPILGINIFETYGNKCISS